MKKLVFLVIGVAVGVFTARRIDETSQGRKFFDTVDARAREFSEAVKDGYQSRGRELRGE